LRDIDYFGKRYTSNPPSNAGVENEASPVSETTHASVLRETFCQFCGGKLALGYHFTCHVCGGAYCYSHMTKHSRAHAPGPVEKDRLFSK
jgi:hypothetical protein